MSFRRHVPHGMLLSRTAKQLCGTCSLPLHLSLGWSGSAMVLGKLPVPGRPANLDNSRARAYCACSRCGWELFGDFYSRLSFLFFLSPFHWEMDHNRLNTASKSR